MAAQLKNFCLYASWKLEANPLGCLPLMLLSSVKSRPLIKPRQFTEGPKEGNFSGRLAIPSLTKDDFTRCNRSSSSFSLGRQDYPLFWRALKNFNIRKVLTLYHLIFAFLLNSLLSLLFGNLPVTQYSLRYKGTVFKAACLSSLLVTNTLFLLYLHSYTKLIQRFRKFWENG